MSITVRQVNPAGTRVFAGTLAGGVDVHEALAQTAVAHNIQTATVEMLGGLTSATFTEYDFVKQKRKEPLMFERPLEIVNGHATISQLEGKPHVHLHLVLSFRDETMPHGISVIGGHAAEATAFAVEFVLTSYDGAPVHRALHADTGLMLWDLPAQGGENA